MSSIPGTERRYQGLDTFSDPVGVGGRLGQPKASIQKSSPNDHCHSVYIPKRVPTESGSSLTREGPEHQGNNDDRRHHHQRRKIRVTASKERECKETIANTPPRVKAQIADQCRQAQEIEGGNSDM